MDQMQDLKSSEGRPCQPWSTRLALKTVGEAYLLRQPRSTPASPAGGQERAGGAPTPASPAGGRERAGGLWVRSARDTAIVPLSPG